MRARMKPTSSASVIGPCFAISAFVVAILAGLAVDLPMAQILLRSAAALIVCYPVGMVVGAICQRLIQAHVESHQVALAKSHAGAAEVDAPIEEDEEPIPV